MSWEIILEAIKNNTEWGYFFAFAISFLESLAFVGLAVPGGNLALVMGISTAYHFFGFWTMILISTLGAIFGDVASFYFGKWSVKFFRPDSKILNLKYLNRGEEFFIRHGGKSVFLGRFAGPIRPIIPYIAGLFSMSFRWFMFYNITSAFLWSLLFIGGGYFGGHSWKMINNWSMKIVLFVFPTLVVVIVGFLLKKKNGKFGKER
ncbi:MAG: hypothetical protein A2430_02980 [Candidatus Liptonbacteria bacterium RIFOXYC1_FULL_36_8]|uniref:VTT domain-containing protein n=3 Tax=Candidatus Liptoniibacteriota TaxID=1817909 RepID=A0A1G2CNQ8_9BACT|nr:MAG: hypothetical protein A2390_00090 [Candidatus Liptonbacteria bacterium RIFOXYB1_FULL_36_10]OGZ03178.1 MAG: hypothetical protein A2604_02620 [Candidatus Liptonbacteria bacterium RIFOXYD1_FULL_36_11]OGZ03360.1 MAG: hypothetical protein A2430_02980 [Candidatus Liptonbacteria bacterium RIFOXYC1_FULL_36_8]